MDPISSPQANASRPPCQAAGEIERWLLHGCFLPQLRRISRWMFASREEAGRKLGDFLKEAGAQADLVVGLPRGGVVVAAEVAHVLGLPLDVLVVRKIGHPLQR